eukprot:1192821-Prorocentrum_minimum.AAC.2
MCPTQPPHPPISAVNPAYMLASGYSFKGRGLSCENTSVSRVVLRKHFECRGLAIPLQVLRGLVVLGPAAQKTPTRLRERGRQGWGRTVGRGAYLGGRL